MAEPEKCPDCHRPRGPGREQCAYPGEPTCLRAQLAQRDERIKALEAAGDGLADDIQLMAEVMRQRGNVRTAASLDSTRDAWTKARTP